MGPLAQLTECVLESALKGEITDRPGYEANDPAVRESGNTRNGHRSQNRAQRRRARWKSLCPWLRPLLRAGRSSPKRQRRISGAGESVFSLSAKGLTTGEVQVLLAELYGAQVSRQMISAITDKFFDAVVEWHNRPMDPSTRSIFIDAIHVKLRDRKVANRPTTLHPLSPPTGTATSSGSGPEPEHRRTGRGVLAAPA